MGLEVRTVVRPRTSPSTPAANAILWAGKSRYFARTRGGAEGIRTDVHRGLSEIASYSSLRQSMRAARSRARAFSIATDALASVALFWLRFPAARRSPRLRRIEVERRRRSQQRKVFSRERVKAIPSGLSWAFPLDLLVSSTIVPVPNLFANGQLPAWSAHLHTGQRS
jgi:hypothetical protein